MIVKFILGLCKQEPQHHPQPHPLASSGAAQSWALRQEGGRLTQGAQGRLAERLTFQNCTSFFTLFLSTWLQVVLRDQKHDRLEPRLSSTDKLQRLGVYKHDFVCTFT